MFSKLQAHKRGEDVVLDFFPGLTRFLAFLDERGKGARKFDVVVAMTAA